MNASVTKCNIIEYMLIKIIDGLYARLSHCELLIGVDVNSLILG